MTETEDNKKKKTILNEWTNNPFERVNHSTNFEDYAISSSDEPDFLYERSNPSDIKNECQLPSKVTQNANRESNSFRVTLNSHKFEPKVSPIISSHLSTEQRDSFVDSCLSAGNSSADVTPSGTPQSSPYSIRKAIEGNKMVNTKDKRNTLSANPKRWFYTGFFNPENKVVVDNKSLSSQIPRNPSFKNLCVSNFDINAVGPTSW